MARQLVHRGPDHGGAWVESYPPVAFGHRRLAILDLTESGDQPMTSASGRWTVAFNGEIYNHRAIRADLSGRSLRGHSDTETLVEAIDAWGFEGALERTNGMFAVAAWDRDCQRLLLARDRLGEKPLYWSCADGRLAFASELRALRRIPGLELSIDPAAAVALLRWSFVPHPRTIYREVRQLPPGGMLAVTFDGGHARVAESMWWSLAGAIDGALASRSEVSVDAAAEELEPLLVDAVGLRLESDVALGAFLSGGIDSSLIAALAQRTLPAGRLRTFTVSMPDLGFDEAMHARAVARHLGTEHDQVDLSLQAAFDLIPQLPQLWDEPFADPSMLPSALLCRAARQDLTVCIGGDGGDELFAGYNRHAFGAAIHRRLQLLPAAARRAAAAALLSARPATLDAAARVVSKALPPSRRLPNLGDKAQKAGALLRADGSTWELLAQVWPADELGLSAVAPAVPTLDRDLDGIETMMLADTAVVLPDQMLVKVDRASMAASLEVRVPFLDHRLLEWAWRQPLSTKTRGGVGKLVLRRLAEKTLPSDIVDRPKMGFDPPLGGWLRDELRPWAEDLLSTSRIAEHGWIERERLRTVWNEHLTGARNWDYRLWGVLMLEAWMNEHHPA